MTVAVGITIIRAALLPQGATHDTKASSKHHQSNACTAL